eukprot:g9070.t1
MNTCDINKQSNGVRSICHSINRAKQLPLAPLHRSVSVVSRCKSSTRIQVPLVLSTPSRAIVRAGGDHLIRSGVLVNANGELSSRTVVSNSNVLALERVLQDVVFESRPDGALESWEEIEGAWVLRPKTPPEAIVHFLGSAFIGAAPQLAYRHFLEALASRNILVIATPFSTHFDHLRSADESQHKFDKAMEQLTRESPEYVNAPIYGVGHSLGALLHVLISSKYATRRAGNIMISFNDKAATEVVPLLSQIAPVARFLRPMLTQAASSAVRPTAELVRDTLHGLSPSFVRQTTPLAEQLIPLYFDVAQGNQEFSPTHEETRKRLKSYYNVSRNLLLKFSEDDLDETDVLASLLQDSVISANLDLTLKSLPGDHGRPMQTAVLDLPPEISRAANRAFKTGGSLIDQLSKLADDAGRKRGSATLSRLSKEVAGSQISS